jgi:hypothetical protein
VENPARVPTITVQSAAAAIYLKKGSFPSLINPAVSPTFIVLDEKRALKAYREYL